MNEQKVLRHANYVGSVEFSLEDSCLHGRILHIDDLITYEGETVGELKQEFEAAVDGYLEHCKSIGKLPNRPYGGTFNVRIGPHRHRWVAEHAAENQCSVNDTICRAIDVLRNATAEPIVAIHLSAQIDSRLSATTTTSQGTPLEFAIERASAGSSRGPGRGRH